MNFDKQRMGWIDHPAILGGVPYVTKEWSAYNIIGEAEKKAVLEVLESGTLSGYQASTDERFLGGPAVLNLEQAWSEAFKVKHSVAMNSATSALFAAIAACGVGTGDEVILDPVAMSGAAAAILGNGAIPVFADVDPDTMNLDPDAVASCITARTKAICVIHHAGLPAEMNPLLDLAKKHNLFVIEDNAQAPGATYHDQLTGAIGHIGVFSLNSNKIIQCGEGGIAVTNDDDLAQRLRLIRNHGESLLGTLELDNTWNLVGFNFRMTELSATIASQQLSRLDEMNSWNNRLANHLSRRIEKEFDFLTAPVAPEHSKHVYYSYRMDYDSELAKMPLALFAEAVRAEGVPVRTNHPDVLYRQPIYQNRSARGTTGYPFGKRWYDGEVRYEDGICPNAESLVNTSLSIETLLRYPNTIDDMDRVLDTFTKVILFREEIVAWAEAGRPKDFPWKKTKKATVVKEPVDENKAKPAITEAELMPAEDENVEQDEGRTIVVALGTGTLESARALAPVAEMLMERLDVELHIAVAGPAEDVFRERFRTELKVFDRNEESSFDRDIALWIEQVKPNVVLTGLTGQLEGLDYALQRAAKELGIRSAAILDSWTDYAARLNDPDKKSMLYLPDKYGMPDFTTALEHTQLGIEKQHLQLVGHPLHGDLKQLIPQWRLLRDKARRWLDVDPQMDMVVFLSEPIADLVDDGTITDPGYNEFDALNVTASGLAKLYRGNACILAVREQPEHRSFEDRLHGGEVGEVRVVDITDSPLNEIEWVLAADVVVGMTSPLLVHSACAGIHTIVMQPNLVRAHDRNPLTRRGLVANLETPGDLAIEIRDYDDQDKRTLARIRKEFRWNDEAATNAGKMVIELGKTDSV
jgi:perosamine synthetase